VEHEAWLEAENGRRGVNKRSGNSKLVKTKAVCPIPRG
jgi:hypothetical protein